MNNFLKELQKLRIVTSFYRNQVYFWRSGTTMEEQLGFGFEMRCKTIQNGVDPLQKELIALLQDEILPLRKRLMAIVSRLKTTYEDLELRVHQDEALQCYRPLLQSIFFDLHEMEAVLGDLVSELE